MAESMQGLHRTCRCAEVTKEMIGHFSCDGQPRQRSQRHTHTRDMGFRGGQNLSPGRRTELLLLQPRMCNEDLGKGLRSQVGTMYGTLAKGPRYLEMAEGYVTGIALDENNEIIGYQLSLIHISFANSNCRIFFGCLLYRCR